jgi:lipid II isoglutaminyl synthase (glutamine-hydrolysing)
MFYIALITAKLVNFIIIHLRLGAGYTWPGYVAYLLYPNILNEFKKRYSTKYVFVTGTNGKTTTSKLISHILSKESYSVISNKSGANLINGIVSALLLDTNFFRKKKLDFCVLEVDEFTLPELLKVIEPKVLVLLNLSRDQLDRYGEVDTILDKWLDTLRHKKSFSIVMDSLQPEFHKLTDYFTGPVFYFDNDTSLLEKTNLIGDYNAKNLNAAITVCGLFGVGKERCINALVDFSVAYGRGEEIDYEGKSFRILLAKNPNSFNNNLQLLSDHSVEYDTLLFVLNDEIRDGRDISWIYDIDPIILESVCKDKNIFVTGSRNLDMCTRLVYSGVIPSQITTEQFTQQGIKNCVDASNTNKIIVLPNYSAMLEVRKILTGKEIL